MKVFKTLFLLAMAVAVIGFMPTSAHAQCPAAGSSSVSCTSTLQVTATVQNAVYLSILADTGGCTLTGSDTAAVLAFGNINGLGVGTAPNCGAAVTVTTNPASPTAGTAITSATYTTYYKLFAQVSGFTAGTPAISTAVTDNSSTATSCVSLVEGTRATAPGSLAAVPTGSLSGISGNDTAGAGVTYQRQIGIKVNHANGANTSGSFDKTITYTLTAS